MRGHRSFILIVVKIKLGSSFHTALFFAAGRASKDALPNRLCAEHVQQLGGESPLPILMEEKG
jgi:hypothetical protein